jgi:hypothetical protein
MPLSFGQLPGWWLSIEPNRKWSPSIPEEEWDKLFRECGFSGVDISLKDREVLDLHGHGIVVTSTDPSSSENPQKLPKTIIVTSSVSPGESSLASVLKTTLAEKPGVKDCVIVHHSELRSLNLTDALCISLLDLEGSVFLDLQEEAYNSIQHLLTTCDGALWVTGDIEQHPSQDIVVGLIRTVRWERDLDDPN